MTVRFINSGFVMEYDPTIEDSYRKQVQVDGEQYLLDILDTAGQETYSGLRDSYMRKGDGFLLVYSIDSALSFQEIVEFRNQIVRVRDREDVPMVLVGNKCDLPDRQVSTQEARAFAKSLGIPFMECSAKNGTNIHDVYHEVVRAVLRFQHNEDNKLALVRSKRRALKGMCSMM
eukprot:c9442_g1_i3.p1 GENE.c9442_g1_i3~~c9442_g1_i3.p1  ORF type:complete len:174 (+),score=45.40 c9442_g1_i3:268-789(+)